MRWSVPSRPWAGPSSAPRARGIWPRRWTPSWKSSRCAWRRTGREREALEGEAHSLRQENARLTQELQEARARLAQWEEASQEARQRRVCQELERERDSLIGDIKALRRFRESFRQAVEEDAQSLLRRAESLPSEKLL